MSRDGRQPRRHSDRRRTGLAPITTACEVCGSPDELREQVVDISLSDGGTYAVALVLCPPCVQAMTEEALDHE